MDDRDVQSILAVASILSDGEVADDIATHFTCSEAESIARFISLMRGDDDAQAFLKAHAEGDDEGDEHHALNL